MSPVMPEGAISWIVPILPSAASSTFDAAAADCSIIGASIMIAAAVTLTTATLFF